ncbi:MAG TPA: hypothetical protein DEF88_14640 [Porphyromonadaceae bacterium]|jgi:hypothetical protein|nr:hypothetical protein [Porphyromonadaceae bacterium]HCM21224.1 hypothetical protein [Porphyromonadaceae bacterium]
MLNLKRLLVIILVFAMSCVIMAQDRWQIKEEGKSIRWNIGHDIPHYDHIEMSGLQMSVVLRYGVNADGSFRLERSVIWPMLRTLPNNTHASLAQRFSIDYPSLLIVDGLALSDEKVKSIELDGRLIVVSEYSTGFVNTKLLGKEPVKKIEIVRVLFPSTDKPILCERYTVKNISDKKVSIMVPSHKDMYKTDPQKGKEGSYTLITSIQEGDNGLYYLNPGEEYTFHTAIQAYKIGQKEIVPDGKTEELNRLDYVNEVKTKLQFISPDPVLNTAFGFAKIRASESIYKTAGGLMHGPGGEAYYAAIWANDQCEYVNPFFPFLGYGIGNASAYNSFMHFARFMNSAYTPVPSSIIAEGEDIWNGAKDRGDAAMIAYGASRYALAQADRKDANNLWPLIEWCLEYCKRNLNEKGVVKSNTDELEGRFPAGEANLCTSSLYYDALISAGFLAKELGKNKAVQYQKDAEILRTAIDNYFGATVEGFETYRYYEGNDILRSWICIPLTMGIFERKQGTIDALFSHRLWTENGLLTEAGTKTFWDRSTLYALRGVYAAGERKKATEYFKRYSQQRLLGEHVPYPIEAWPEGSQRHLSAESGLYCRIVTEGIFGIKPTGFKSFDLTPQLPDTWDKMELKNIYAFNVAPFDIEVKRKSDKQVKIIIKQGNNILKSILSHNGAKCSIIL